MDVSETSTTLAALADFQHWKDPQIKARGFARWDEIAKLAGRAFATDPEKTGRQDGTWWYLLQYDDIVEVFKDFQAFPFGEVQPGVDVIRAIPAEIDPPEHGKYRNLLSGLFTPGAVKAREGQIRQLCRSLIADFVGEGECDFMRDFANKYPTGIFLQLLGLPLDTLPYYANLMECVTHNAIDEDQSGTGIVEAQNELVRNFTELLEERRKAPGNDLISYLLTCQIDGRQLDQGELLSISLTLLRGGLDTVVAQLGHTFAHLAKDVELRLRIKDDPKIVPKVVEEMLRFYAIATMSRRVAEDIDYAGCPMKAADRVILPCMTANRDTAKWPDADKFDVDRAKIPHIGFGAGPHSCIGLHLAKLEMRIAIEEWIASIPDFDVKDGTEPELVLTDAFVGVKELWLQWPKPA